MGKIELSRVDCVYTRTVAFVANIQAKLSALSANIRCATERLGTPRRADLACVLLLHTEKKREGRAPSLSGLEAIRKRKREVYRERERESAPGLAD